MIQSSITFYDDFSCLVALEHKTLSPYFTFSNGYQVPKGKLIFILIIIFLFNIKKTNKLFLNELDRIVHVRVGEIHFDEELQGQNPNEFNAFRHVKKNSSATRVEKSYLPFGLGKHACPGRHFAISEIKVVLHHLLLNYDIRKVNNEKIRPVHHGGHLAPSDEGLIFEKRV